MFQGMKGMPGMPGEKGVPGIAGPRVSFVYREDEYCVVHIKMIFLSKQWIGHAWEFQLISLAMKYQDNGV